MMDNQRPVMDFPTIFHLRVIGNNEEDFATFVLVQVRRHVPELNEDSIISRPSNGGKYLAVKISFVAYSRAQLDEIYYDLSAEERVLFIL